MCDVDEVHWSWCRWCLRCKGCGRWRAHDLRNWFWQQFFGKNPSQELSGIKALLPYDLQRSYYVRTLEHVPVYIASIYINHVVITHGQSKVPNMSKQMRSPKLAATLAVAAVPCTEQGIKKLKDEMTWIILNLYESFPAWVPPDIPNTQWSCGCYQVISISSPILFQVTQP